MNLTLITPTYNSAKTIARTMDSVLAQNYSNLEYLIINGASSDNTREIVLKYQDKLNIKLISEPDKGIYDAMNKGIKLASGEVVGILNSDDIFDNPDILTTIIQAFSDKNIDVVYGDIQYFSDDVNEIKRYWKAGEYHENNLCNGWTIPHPSLFLRKEVYDKFGSFNADFKLAGDYEFILRLLKIHKIKTKYIPQVFVRMYDGGASGSTLEQRKKGWDELKKAWTVNNLKVPTLFIFRRVLFKLSQYLPFTK